MSALGVQEELGSRPNVRMAGHQPTTRMPLGRLCLLSRTINTFNPQPVTANNRERGYFVSAMDRWILADGGFVQSLFAVKQLDSRVYPATLAGEMVLAPEQ